MSLRTAIIHELFNLSRKHLPGRLALLFNKAFDILKIKINAVVQIDGIYFSIDTHNYHERGVFCFGKYEIGTRNFITNYTSNIMDGLVIDVGANIGLHSLAMAASARSSDVKVIAFEANPEMASKLRLNLALNNLSNVHVYPIGLNDREGEFELGLPYIEGQEKYHNPGIASMVDFSRSVRKIKVTCKTLDSALIDYGFGVDNVSLIKLDVEGKEFDILNGSEMVLRKSSPAIILEYNNQNFEKIRELLSRYGYQVIGSLLRYGINKDILTENILFLKNNGN